MAEEETANEETTNEPVKKFSQEDVDRVVAERLARERKRFADYDELKAKVEEAKSDSERAIEEAVAAGKREVAEQYHSRLFESEVKAIASKFRFRDAGDALAGFGDRDGLIDEHGVVDSARVEARLKEIADSKPYLVDSSTPPAQRPNRRRTVPNDNQSTSKKAAELLRDYARSR